MQDEWQLTQNEENLPQNISNSVLYSTFVKHGKNVHKNKKIKFIIIKYKYKNYIFLKLLGIQNIEVRRGIMKTAWKWKWEEEKENLGTNSSFMYPTAPTFHLIYE